MCTHWPGEGKRNDNAPVASLSSVVRMVAKRVGVAPKHCCASRPKGACPSGGHAGLVLLQTGPEEGVTLVADGAVLPPVGGEVTALPVLQMAQRVLELLDLYLEHAHRTHQLEDTREHCVTDRNICCFHK